MDESKQEQFMRLWTAAQPSVAGYVRAMVPDFHQAEDLLQDIAVLLVRKFDDYDPARPFVAWAVGFAKFEVLSSRRSHSRSFLTYQPDVLDAVTDTYGEIAPELEAEKFALNKCLTNVKGRNRDMITMRYWRGMKPGEIAEQLGMKPVTVRVALSRVRSALQKCVKQQVAAEGGTAG